MLVANFSLHLFASLKQVNLVPDHTAGDADEPYVLGSDGDRTGFGHGDGCIKLAVRDLPLHSRSEPLPGGALL